MKKHYSRSTSRFLC